MFISCHLITLPPTMSNTWVLGSLISNTHAQISRGGKDVLVIVNERVLFHE